VHGDQLALAVLGSKDKLHRSEIESFFPDFLGDLATQNRQAIDYDLVNLLMGERNQFAKGKMLLYPPR
jgi:hypothetical protein